MTILELMAAPFAECMVLVGIHTYLGVHVLRRRVIFVDLALAQIAALGTMVGFFFGILPDTTAALVFSMMFAFVGAGLFAVTRIRSERVPQEAIIGLVYAITAATAVLVVEKTQGAEHLKDILVGSLLWVTWSDVGIAAVAYILIGLVHYALRRQFLLISEDPDEAHRRGMNVRAWDFLFYVTFGFVIAFSTRVAGVLLVFVFLVAPAIMGFLITDRLRNQLIIGWIMGTVVTVLGLYLSYVQDLPSGPAVVACYGLALVLGAVVVYLWRAPDKPRALKVLGAGTIVTGLVGVMLYAGATGLAATSLAHSEAVAHVEENLARESTMTPRAGPVDTTAFEIIPKGCVTRGNLREYAAFEDADARLDHCRAEFERGRMRGLKCALLLLSDPSTPPFYRGEAVALLQDFEGQTFGINPDVDPRGNQDAFTKLCASIQAGGFRSR